MALSQPRVNFGVHSFTAYKRADGMPYGPQLRVLQGSTFKLEGNNVELFGGSNRFAWAIEEGDTNASFEFSVSEYPNWLFEVFGGKAPTVGNPEASGNVSQLANKKGTSVVNGTTGLLATVTVSSAADLKFGKYVIKATAANAFKVYAMSDVDFSRGALLSITNDDMEIASFTGVAGNGSTHAIAALGITFTTGSGTTAFTIGDTATFEIRPVNTLNREVKIGGISDSLPEFSAVLYLQKRASGAVFECEVYKMKASGLSLGAERKAFSQNDYSAQASYDSVENAVCRIREVE
jgi:hypothetical protein